MLLNNNHATIPNFKMSNFEREEVTNYLARHAYSLLLDALRARGRVFPQPEFERTLENVRLLLNISEHCHSSEIKRVFNDDRLTSLARMNVKSESINAWNNQWSEMLPFEVAGLMRRVSGDRNCRRLADQLQIFSHRHNENLKRKQNQPELTFPNPVKVELPAASSCSSSLEDNSKMADNSTHFSATFNTTNTNVGTTIAFHKEEVSSPDVQESLLKRSKILETKIDESAEIRAGRCIKSSAGLTRGTTATTSVLVACGQQLFFVPSAAILVQPAPPVAANASVVSTGSNLQLNDSLLKPSLGSKLEHKK